MINALSYYLLGRLMQQFLPHILVNHAFSLHAAVEMERAPRIITVEVERGKPINLPNLSRQEVLSPELRAAFKPGLQMVNEEVEKLELRSSYDTLHLMLERVDKPEYTIKGLADDATELHGRLVSELKYTTCFALWGKEETLYEAKHLLGKEVSDQFPSAAVDIEEAGKC